MLVEPRQECGVIHAGQVAAPRPERGAVAPRLELSVIIVSYKTRALTLRCLRAIEPQLQELTAEIWVVDNNSRDGTIEAIEAEMPEVKIIASDDNRGFGAGNNLAMRRAGGEYFLLLNSDAFPAPGAIGAMLQSMREHPDVAVVGPRLLNDDQTLQLSCFRFPSPAYAWGENLGFAAGYRRWAHDREREVDWVIGACMLVRRAAYEKVGGFDERFFMYGEETDWQRRMRAAQWTVRFTPAAQAVHLGRGGSSGRDADVENHFFDSLDLYELKHHGITGALALRAAMIAGCSLRAAFWSAVALCRPGSAAGAWQKARRHARLVARQATHRLGPSKRGATT